MVFWMFLGDFVVTDVLPANRMRVGNELLQRVTKAVLVTDCNSHYHKASVSYAYRNAAGVKTDVRRQYSVIGQAPVLPV